MQNNISRPNPVASFFRTVASDWKLIVAVLAAIGVIVAIVTGVPPTATITAVPPPTAHTLPTGGPTTPLWQTLLLGAIIGFIYFDLVRSLWSGESRAHWHFFRKLTLGAMLSAIPVSAAVLATAVFLSHFTILNRSWMYHLSAKSGNANTVALSTPFVGWVMFAVLLASLPSLAKFEEEMFRKGTKNWTDALLRSLAFGLVHCLVGVPVFAGLALTVAGLWFSFQYFRGGVERSTVYHLAYNLVILSIFAIAIYVL